MRKRVRIVEIIVAVVVLVLLLIAVFPRFLNAQKRWKIAAAKSDLAKIMQSMEAYRLDYGGEAIQSCLAHREYLNPNTFYTVITTLANNRDVILPPDVLLPYLKAYPVPRLPDRITGNPVAYGPMYMVGRHDYRFLIRQYNGREADEALFWFTFYKDMYKTDYLGVAHGPLLAFENSKDRGEGFDGRRQYVPYDPSNGLISHGYIVSEWEPNPSPTPTVVPSPLPSPTYWKPAAGELKANLTTEPTPVTIGDATALVQHFQKKISTLNLTWCGNCTDNQVSDDLYWNIEITSGNRAKAIRGVLPDRLTPQDIDTFIEQNRKPRTIPLEFTYICSGKNKQIKGLHTPRLSLQPWEANQKHIINNAECYHINDTAKDKWLTRSNIEYNLIQFHHFQFHPLWSVFPLNELQGKAIPSWEPQSDGTIRVRWKDTSWVSDMILYSSFDMSIDPAIGYMPRKVLYVVPDRGSRLDSPLSENEINRLDVWYSELFDFKAIDGVYFPARMKITHWHQVGDERMIPENSRGLIKGFRISDVIGGENVPDFDMQWDVNLVSASINQPVDEKIFSPEAPEGYQVIDSRR